MTDDFEPGEEGLREAFESLRDHVVQIVTDLTHRVNAGIIAEDDGRFGPPSLGDLLRDLTGQAADVLVDLGGLDSPGDVEGSDGES